MMIKKYLQKLGPTTWYGKLSIVVISLIYLGVGIVMFPFIAFLSSVHCMSSNYYFIKVTCVPLELAVPILFIVCGCMLPLIKQKRARIVALILPLIFAVLWYGIITQIYY